MHHEVLMSKLHRFTDLQEHLQPLPQRNILSFAETMNRNTIYELHHQIRIAVVGHAAAQKASDVGMLKAG